MSPRFIRNLSKIGAFVILAFSFISPARADIHSQVQDAHHFLEQALNPGGDTPSDADRINSLNSALDALKNLPPIHRPKRVTMIRQYIRTAIDAIKNGDPDHQAANDIRDADSAVRDLESAS
jgi:hypothetical protein